MKCPDCGAELEKRMVYANKGDFLDDGPTTWEWICPSCGYNEGYSEVVND